MDPGSHAFLRNMLTHKVRGDKVFEIPLRMKNVLDFLDLDATGSLPEDVQGDFGADAIHLRLHEVGCARQQDGRWVYPLTGDPTVKYELVKKERSRVVTIRSLQQIGPSQVLTHTVVTLPEGAHDIDVTGKPSQLVYRLSAPPAQEGAGKPSLRLEAKPYIMSALYPLYADRRFSKLWAARSVFHNSSGENLADYRVRYRIQGHSEWSDWQRTECVYPGQTVVDRFQPVIDVHVRDLRAPTRAMIEVEQEYARPGGEKVHATAMAATKLLGFHDGVYTDVKMTADMPWCELLKGMPWVLASFTAGNDPVMHEVVDVAREAAGGAAPTDGDEEARRFLEAVYNLARRNIAYEGGRSSMVDGVFSQYLKYGRDVLQSKKGTCINTAIFHASVAEAAGLESAVVVVPQHAYAAVRLPKSQQWLPIETTMGTVTANQPFARACQKGQEEFQEAAKSGLFLLVNIRQMRAKGVTSPALADVGTRVLPRWHILPPVAEDGTGMPDSTGGEEAAATIVEVRKEPNVFRDGRKGMAFHVHLKIQHARGKSCLLAAMCMDEARELVDTDLDDYRSPNGHLTSFVSVTPDDDDAEWDDLVLFFPYEAIEVGPGTHPFEAVFLVGSEAGKLTREPTVIPFKIIKGR
jgi:hypothetical protein